MNIESTQFIERPVPLDVRNLGVVRAWKPADGRDFRLVLDKHGKLSVFPHTKLTILDMRGVALMKKQLNLPEKPAQELSFDVRQHGKATKARQFFNTLLAWIIKDRQ